MPRRRRPFYKSRTSAYRAESGVDRRSESRVGVEAKLAACPVELTISVNKIVANTRSSWTWGRRPVRNSSTVSSEATLSDA
jgi:hypothetical protein